MAKTKDDFKKYLEKQSKDPEFKEEWGRLEPRIVQSKKKIKMQNKKKTKK